jgi:hypothetical protein
MAENTIIYKTIFIRKTKFEKIGEHKVPGWIENSRK